MPVELVTSHRERKKQATRQALHDAAFALADEFGLAGVTIEAIAARADVAPRTFFNYFSSKEEAILDRDPGRAEMLHNELVARPVDEDPLTALRRVMEGEMVRRTVDPDRFLRHMALIRSEPQLRAAMAAISEDLERALVTALAERTGQDPDEDLYPSLVVGVTWGAFKAVHMHWSTRVGSVPFDTLLADALDSLAGGLTPLPRRRRR